MLDSLEWALFRFVECKRVGGDVCICTGFGPFGEELSS